MENLKNQINEQITTATEENSINPLILGSLMEETVDGILDIVVPTEVSELNNDVGYITLAQVPVGFDGDYNSLTNKPTIPSDTGDLTNGAGYITIADIPVVPTELSELNNDVGFITINDVPTGFSGDYGDLINKPNIPTEMSDLNNDLNFIDLSDLTWANISDKPNLFSGDYDDLTNKPTIPTNNNQLINGSGYITLSDVQPEDIDIINSTIISFTEPQIYGNHSTPITGAITFDLTDAKVGMIQEMYHSGSALPTLPANAVITNEVEYSSDKVNLLLFKYISASRIEVVISVLEN